MPLAALVLALLVLLPAPAHAASSWSWPLGGAAEVSRPFALGPTPYSPGHRGADLPGREGQPVLAAGAGRVSFSGLLAGRGVLVVVHGALRTTYEPVSATVGVGQPVAAGQQIGRLVAGHAGCPVEACLHWGLRRGRDYLDPVRLVRGGPVRLLPQAGSPGSGAGGRAAPRAAGLLTAAQPLAGGTGTAGPGPAPLTNRAADPQLPASRDAGKLLAPTDLPSSRGSGAPAAESAATASPLRSGTPTGDPTASTSPRDNGTAPADPRPAELPAAAPGGEDARFPVLPAGLALTAGAGLLAARRRGS